MKDKIFASDRERTQTPDAVSTREIYRKGNSEAQPITITIGDRMLGEIDEFADCVPTGKKPETGGLASLKALSLIGAAIASSQAVACAA